MATNFTPAFNNFQKINATQAWSMFFSISKTDSMFGLNPTLGRLLTVALFAAIIASAIEIVVTAA